VFEMLGEGCATRQIADNLGVSLKSVQAYCARIKEKLNLGSAAELMRDAVRHKQATAQNDPFLAPGPSRHEVTAA
jgi:DNA-binding NarL/FixJ family response regulator